MNKIKLYRRRFMPNETVLLKDDIIIYKDEHIIITKWTVLKPRKDFNNGISCYYLDKNIKLSKIYLNEKFIHTYIDIIETIFNENENSYCFNDLLVDVIVSENGMVKVLDLDELTDALEESLITFPQMKLALKVLNDLLIKIYDGALNELTAPIDNQIYEENL